jgi:hypothetical protein
MNRSKILGIAGVAAVLFGALALRSCMSEPSPVGPGITSIGPNIDSELDRLGPQLTITPESDSSYTLGMTVGAGGSPDAPAMRALRSINAVEFTVYSPDRKLISTQRTESISPSGVSNQQTGEASTIMHASVSYRPPSQLPAGAYAFMTVIGTNGVALRSATFPDVPVVH